MINKLKLGIAFGFAITQLSFGQTSEVTATFGVRGNCGMCKATIEKAAQIDGVSSAKWNVDKKEIEISYNPKTTRLKEVHASIAEAGYDTDQTNRIQKSYDNLHGCCKYDPNMKMGGGKE